MKEEFFGVFMAVVSFTSLCSACCPQYALDVGALYNPVTGKCFKKLSGQSDWFTAGDRCNVLSAELATPDTADDTDFLHSNGVVTGWTGINDINEEGLYVDAFGYNVTSFLWKDNQPNDYQMPDDQDCVILNLLKKWEDKSCDEKHNPLCEWPFVTVHDGLECRFKTIPDSNLCDYKELMRSSVGGLLRCARLCTTDLFCLLFAFKKDTTTGTGEHGDCILYKYALGKSEIVPADFKLYKPHWNTNG